MSPPDRMCTARARTGTPRLRHACVAAGLEPDQTQLPLLCLCFADVKELVPEFFSSPEFLLNSNRFALGVKQARSPALQTLPHSQGAARQTFVPEALCCELRQGVSPAARGVLERGWARGLTAAAFTLCAGRRPAGGCGASALGPRLRCAHFSTRLRLRTGSGTCPRLPLLRS